MLGPPMHIDRLDTRTYLSCTQKAMLLISIAVILHNDTQVGSWVSIRIYEP